MQTKTKTIGTSMRELRQARRGQTSSNLIPEAMVESIRQSMCIEGYDVTAKEARDVIEKTVRTSL